MKPSSYLVIVIIIVSLVFGVYALTYPDIKSKLLPATISGLIFILAVIQLWRELSGVAQAGEATESKVEKADMEVRGGDLRSNMKAFVWLAGIILAIYLVGFLISIPVFIFSYLKSFGHGWLKSVLIAAVSVIVVYLVFVISLKVALYPGLLFELLSH